MSAARFLRLVSSPHYRRPVPELWPNCSRRSVAKKCSPGCAFLCFHCRDSCRRSLAAVRIRMILTTNRVTIGATMTGRPTALDANARLVHTARGLRHRHRGLHHHLWAGLAIVDWRMMLTTNRVTIGAQKTPWPTAAAANANYVGSVNLLRHLLHHFLSARRKRHLLHLHLFRLLRVQVG